MMPGTLVEEAALRREIFVAGQLDDFDKFETLAMQYFRRFRHSIYAGNFRQRFSLVRGKLEMTDLAAERVMTLTEVGSPERERARLYRAAARLVTSTHEEALLDLRQIEEARLPERDVELLTAALTLGSNVRKALPEVAAQRDEAGRGKTAMRPRIDFTRSLAAVDRAQKLLDESERALKGADR